MRQRWQFGLRSFIIWLLVGSVTLGSILACVRRVRQQRSAADSIELLGGTLHYVTSEPIGPGECIEIVETSPPGPWYLRELLGDQWFAERIEVEFESVMAIACGPNGSSSVQVPMFKDEDLVHLQKLGGLHGIKLANTGLTKQGLARLRRTYPDLVVVR